MIDPTGQATADALFNIALWLDKRWYRWPAAIILFVATETALIVLTT